MLIRGEKTKSDRINALRKQYDAFLDEDKKRKDRNAFILGRLENMRLYTPTVSPVRQSLESPNKHSIITQERPDYLRKIRFDDNTIVHSRSPSCEFPDEQRILQEISKKYILIPKLRPTQENSITCYNPSNLGNDTDWRNKYNILDELKKFEKEGSSEVSKDTDIPNNTFNKGDPKYLQSMKSMPENLKDSKLIGKTNLYGDSIYNAKENNAEVPVTTSQTLVTKMGLTNDLKNCDIDYNIISDNVKTSSHDINTTGLKKEVISSDLKSLNQQQICSDSKKINEQFNPDENRVNKQVNNEYKNTENMNYDEAQDTQQNQINIVPSNISPTNETLCQSNVVELSSVNIVDSTITEALIQNEYIDPSLEETFENIAQRSEIIENVDLNANIGHNEPVSEIQQQDYEPNHEEQTVVTDNIIPSQINEFEAEQKEMFYSEETEYNQNVDTTGYNTQNEQYTNEQYSYYNETQQEQPYYPEVNEHEESTERYDPNYEQQYGENYAQNVNIAQYENQPYVGDNYENQLEVSNVNYEPGQQEITNTNYETHPAQQDVLYEQPGQQELANASYEQQRPDLQELTNANYEQQLIQQEVLTNVDYEQQPFTYEYEQTATENIDQNQIENVNTYDGQASEVVNYETQQYNEGGEVNQALNPDQSVYEGQQDYVQPQQEPVQNLEQLDGQGYVETQNAYQSENVAAVGNTGVIEPNKMT